MFEHIYYLAFLSIAIASLMVVDHKEKLAIFFDARRTLITLAEAEVIFIMWDIIGIRDHIFHIGSSSYLTGVRLGTQLPMEELVFLFLLTYSALLLWRGGIKLWPRT